MNILKPEDLKKQQMCKKQNAKWKFNNFLSKVYGVFLITVGIIISLIPVVFFIAVVYIAMHFLLKFW